ncbi:NAD(P)-binding protein [Irpex lacteus]|nr:NAD(P)-binding protein [Irpex lacteus]
MAHLHMLPYSPSCGNTRKMDVLKNYYQALCQFFPPKTTFTVDQIPDLTGRVVIITGGYSGIGKETTKILLGRNAKVYIAGRSRAKANEVILELKEITGREALFLELDLADLASVRRSTQKFLSQEQELHVLFNNAGVYFNPIEQLTADGYDMQFGTNVTGHWYFTELLLPALLRGRASSPDGYARVITTSSSTAYYTTLDWSTFNNGKARRRLGSRALYSQSKFGNAVVAIELARRYGNQGILSIPVNPGNIKTEIHRNVGTVDRYLINTLPVLYPASLGALTQLYAGTMPEALNYNGQFLIPWARAGRLREEAYDPEVGIKLWDWLQEQVKDL